MKTLHQPRKGFTLIELLVVIAIIAILAALAVPQIAAALTRGQLTQSVSNGRQIFISCLNMANDYAVNQDTHLGWPGDLAVATTEPVSNISDFAARLVKYDYVKQADLGKIFSAPGVKAYTGTGTFASENSAYKIYLVTETDVSNVLFCATKNFTFGNGLDATAKPYGEKGFIIVRKGGDATSFSSKQQALDKNLMGFMPGSTSQDSPGTESDSNTWK